MSKKIAKVFNFVGKGGNRSIAHLKRKIVDAIKFRVDVDADDEPRRDSLRLAYEDMVIETRLTASDLPESMVTSNVYYVYETEVDDVFFINFVCFPEPMYANQWVCSMTGRIPSEPGLGVDISVQFNNSCPDLNMLRTYLTDEDIKSAAVNNLMCAIQQVNSFERTLIKSTKPVSEIHISQQKVREFDFWELDLTKPKYEKRVHLGGTHASPREHTRRGHWRTCKSGKRVWVRSCVCGDPKKGRISKDYRLTAA